MDHFRILFLNKCHILRHLSGLKDKLVISVFQDGRRLGKKKEATQKIPTNLYFIMLRKDWVKKDNLLKNNQVFKPNVSKSS